MQLAQIAPLVPWEANSRFVELRTAKAWGMSPTAWDELSADDKAEMIVYEEQTAQMAAHEYWVQSNRQG